MDKIRHFADAITSVGIYVVRRDDFTILYYNQKISQVSPGVRLGAHCEECFAMDCRTCPIRTLHTQENNLTISYSEEWGGYVELSADEYMWEEKTPAYIIMVVPQMRADAIKESVRYNRMVDKAAMVLSESVAYGNFTRNTYTKYREQTGKKLRSGETGSLQKNYERMLKSIHPQERDEFRRVFSVSSLKKHFDGNGGEVYGEFRQYSNGRYHWISFRCIPIENAFDEDVLCVFIIRNINVRKQLEQQLATQLNATYQSIPGGVVILRMDGDMSIVNASQGFYDMMGKLPEDYKNGYFEHIFEVDRQIVLKKTKRLAGRGEPFDFIYREKDSKGVVHWVQARGTKIGEEDGVPIYLIIRMDVTELKRIQQQLIEEQEQYRQYTDGIIDTLGNLVEFRDTDSGEHIKRTKALTRILLNHLSKEYPEFQFTEETIEKIAEAAALHDVGKIAISDTILNKPGRLTEDEFEEMKKHTVKGYEILKTLNLSQDEESHRYSLDISRHHHERWDGNGYPDRLKGNEIPIWSQVVSIVDVYDALVSPRVYKKAYSHEKAAQMILDGECGVFNPKLLKCFRENEALLRHEYGQ